MRTTCLSLMFVLFTSISVMGDDISPSLKAPAETKIKQGKLGKIVVETTGKTIKWVTLTPGLDIQTCTPDGKTLTFTGLPGRYEILLYTALGDVPSDPIRIVVIIESTIPEPDPIVPPVADDVLKKKISDAFLADKGEKADAIQLAALYREASKLTMKKTANKYDAPSSKELLRRVRESGTALIGSDVLLTVRVTAADELAKVFGTPSDTDLTEVQRKAAAECFLKLALAIDALFP